MRLDKRLVMLCAAAALALAAAPASAADVVCAVEAVDGDESRMWSNGLWRPLEAGAQVPRDAIVVTGEDTRAKIVCADGLVLTLGVSTEVNLETLADPRNERVAQLVRGVLGVFSPRRLREALDIRTPVATASVGSSQSLVEFTPEKGAAVFVREGAAKVRAGDGSAVELRDGEGVSIGAAGVAEPVKVWGDARIRVSTDALGFDW